MLVLSRKPGQSLILGEEIRVKIVEVRGQQVRIGIEAPQGISVVREELYRQVAAANRQSARVDPGGKQVSDLAALFRNENPTQPEGSAGEKEEKE